MTWPAGQTYRITQYRAVDGDTIRAHLLRETLTRADRMDPWVTEDIVRTRTDPQTHPEGLSLRLITLNTPERGTPGYLEARRDLDGWLKAFSDRLVAEVWPGGGFDRMLADVYVAGHREVTASEHMLMIGWEPYLGPRGATAG